MGGTIAKLIQDLFQFMNPQLLRLLISFVEEKNPIIWHGSAIVMLMLFVGVMKSIMINLYFERMMKIGMKLKSNIIHLIYTKSLRLSSTAKKERSTGEIVNLISVDSNRFQDVLWSINLVWSAPLQIVLGIYFLYQELGVSIFAGVACIVAIIPINAYLINFQKTVQFKQMKHKDERIKLMNEILAGVRILKLYAWENKFIDNVSQVRATETSFIRKSYLISLASTFFFTCTTVLVSVATFTVYIFLSKDNVLTPQKAFTSMVLFSILQFPINLLPMLVNLFILAQVALKRINTFLNAEEITNYVDNDYDKENALIIEGKPSFAWDIEKEEEDDDKLDKKKKKKDVDKKKKDTAKNSSSIANEEKNMQNGNNKDISGNGLNNGDAKKEIFNLKDIEFKVKKGSFTAVIGQVGSGKSSLISAILGEMQLKEDNSKPNCKINISNDLIISYGAQLAWIQNDTFRGNILFGQQFDEKKYEEVIRACALEPDLEVLPGQDLCEIGEKGINLSGGQKQRINLARVCYSGINLDQSKQFVLLDDPLSAVDAHVGKHLIENVLSSKTGLLKDTTRILITNQLNVLKSGYCDQILVMKDGKIVFDCNYDELVELEEKGELIKYGITLKGHENTSDEEDESKEDEKQTKPKKDVIDSDRKLIETEKLETQEVSLKDYFIYIKNAGIFTTLICILLYVCEHSLVLGSNVYLSSWTNNKFNETTDKEMIFEFNKEKLGYYSLISGLQCLANLAGNFFLVIAAVATSISFHRQLLKGILR